MKDILINSAAAAGKLTITNAGGAANLLPGGNGASRIFEIYAARMPRPHTPDSISTATGKPMFRCSEAARGI